MGDPRYTNGIWQGNPEHRPPATRPDSLYEHGWKDDGDRPSGRVQFALNGIAKIWRSDKPEYWQGEFKSGEEWKPFEAIGSLEFITRRVTEAAEEYQPEIPWDGRPMYSSDPREAG